MGPGGGFDGLCAFWPVMWVVMFAEESLELHNPGVGGILI